MEVLEDGMGVLEERVEVLEVTVALLEEDINRVEDDIDSLQIETGVLTVDMEGNTQRLSSVKFACSKINKSKAVVTRYDVAYQ